MTSKLDVRNACKKLKRLKLKKYISLQLSEEYESHNQKLMEQLLQTWSHEKDFFYGEDAYLFKDRNYLSLNIYILY